MAFRAMKDSVLRESEYHARAKRCGITVGLDDAELIDHRQDTGQQIEGKVLLEQAAGAATPKEAKILRFLLDGFAPGGLRKYCCTAEGYPKITMS
mgnify:CR=1 FL=1